MTESQSHTPSPGARPSRAGEEARRPPAGFRPADAQPPLPMDRLVVEEAPGEDALPLDVLFVGGGPAGLAGAIELARLARGEGSGSGMGDLQIGVLEKAGRLGDHCLSGAVVVPGPFRRLFPEVAEEDLPFRRRVPGDRVYWLTGPSSRLRVPTPPTMRNDGNWVASICEIVRWMGERAEALGVDVFTGFPAESLLVSDGGVAGVRTAPAGLDRDGEPGSGYMPATDVAARATVLAEGTRGALTQAFLQREGIGSRNPQIFALGVKELWKVERSPESVIHTMGWPLPDDVFGGSWIYPMADDLVSLGLVAGLDYPERDLDVHVMLQRLKEHPLVRELLEGGELVEWGAKTIPEGGYWSLPDRLHGDGVVVVGDAAGLVNVPSLKGIHYAVESGILAARTIFEALADDGGAEGAARGPLPARRLAGYDQRLRSSFVHGELYRTRNMRLAFRDGFHVGGAKAALMQLTGGRLPGGWIRAPADAEVARGETTAEGGEVSESELTVDKTQGVFHAGNATRDDIPSHLVVGDEVSPELAEFYAGMCPAGVYEVEDGRLVVNAPNCIDCKATDVLGPRWTPREGGSGPSYERM